MLFIWGTKRVTRTLGYVADFCYICRQPSTFKLESVSMAGHIYYIAPTKGKLVGFERLCTCCGTRFAADPQTYNEISKTLMPLNELMYQTYPNLNSDWQERLALESRIKKNHLNCSSEEKNMLTREPFIYLSPTIEARFSGPMRLDWQICLSLLLMIVVIVGIAPYIAPVISPMITPFKPVYFMEDFIFGDTGSVMLAIDALSFLAVVVVFMGRNGRYLQRTIIPRLAKTFMPIKPTQTEIKDALQELKKAKYQIGIWLLKKKYITAIVKQANEPTTDLA